MEDYVAVNRFLDHLGPIDKQSFDQWWEQQWIPHQQKCINAAKHVYVVEHAVQSSRVSDNVNEVIQSACKEVGLDYDEFMEFGWGHIKKKIDKINDGE